MMAAVRTFHISIAKDFKSTPGPRRRDEGKHSGEQFLEELLQPRFQEALDAAGLLTVDLDGCAGFATSFLEAAFGGLARKFGSAAVMKHLNIESSDEPMLKEEISQYISDVKK